MGGEKKSRNENDKTRTLLKAPVAGGAAGFCTRAITQPLDCVKIRHQLQIEPISWNSEGKYKSIFQTAQTIFKEEGLRAFWKGHVPGQFLSITYGFGRFLVSSQCNQYLKTVDFFKKHPDTRHFVSGGFSGALLTFVATPFDVVRTRFIAQDNNKGYHSVPEAFKAIWRHEGIRGIRRHFVDRFPA